ncbi:hypothetical protein H4582DRAFT_2100711 [Lactarius indigo]|nr:hypothetical protein H4582DRAFT_2100711 [Lactarius indigo]
MNIALNDDVLLCIFNYYRLDKKDAWNVRLGWCKLAHVCQRWRYLIYESAYHLGLHILCTNGTPTVDTLGHLPPFPIFVSYEHTDVTIWKGDELGIYHALRLRGRVRRIDLRLPPSILHRSLMLMDGGYFPRLEHLSLSVAFNQITTLMLPKIFLAPNLRHLVLSGVTLPKGLRFLSSTVSLVTLVLRDIRASGYLFPRLLVSRLHSLPQLEELSIGFSVPIPRPNAEVELLSYRGTPLTLPKLKTLGFQGVSAYLECLVAQIRAPLLERLDIALFTQISFTLPLLSHFVINERIKLESARVHFGRDAVSIIMDHRHVTERNDELLYDGNFRLRVMCKQLDWQIDCAGQVCSALISALSGVEDLALDFHGQTMPSEWQNGGIEGSTWHELLRPFIGVTRLHIYETLSNELSRALQVDETGLDPGFLPSLRELTSFFEGARPHGLFDSFIQARRVAGRPVSSSFRLPPSSRLSSTNYSETRSLLVDGYISQTFAARDAELYFFNLLRSNSIPQIETLSYPEREGHFFSVGHSTYSRILDRTVVHRGTVVPQRIWSLRPITDRWQHVGEAVLQMPIFFEGIDGRLGLSLEAAAAGRCHGLRNAQEFVPLGQKLSTSIRIAWQGYKDFKRRVQIRDATSEHNPITIARFAHHIGRSVDAFLKTCGPDPDPTNGRWQIRPFGIQRCDIIVIGAVHVSAGSWMPILQLNRYIL